MQNDLISHNQSGFKPKDSCINQPLPITHKVYKSFDEGYETSSVFLDISKAFDKIWHKSFLHKRKENCISSNLLNIVTHFLYQRKQRVFLNEQYSTWTTVEAGVLQCSILDHCFFLKYMSDLA